MPVVRCPFFVVYDARSNGAQVEIRHSVRAYHHGALFFIESVYDGLQRLRTAIEVVAVQLYGEAAA